MNAGKRYESGRKLVETNREYAPAEALHLL